MSEAENVIDAFVRGRELLLARADEVPADLRTKPFVGHWNLMDVLAHLVGWDYTNVNAIESLKHGDVPDFYREYDPGWAAYNRQLIDRYGASDWDELRAELIQSQAAITRILRLLTPEDLERELSRPQRPRPLRRPVTIAGILRAAIRDEREHTRQIRDFVAATAGL